MAEGLKSYYISSGRLFHQNYTSDSNVISENYLPFENETILFYFVTFGSVVLACLIALVHRGLSDMNQAGDWEWEGMYNCTVFFISCHVMK